MQEVANGPPMASTNFADDVLSAAQDVSACMTIFMDDRFTVAVARTEPWANESVYHAACKMLLHFMQALFSYEPAEIECAIQVIKVSSEVCSRRRHPSSLTNNVLTQMVMRPNYDNYTEVEIHAELCTAECLLVRALLTFIQDDSFVSLIGGGLRLRTCFQIYKECQYMLHHRRNWPNTETKQHFESGVHLGLGMFNLLISTLPKRILKLLEFVGFSGNRSVAMEHLEAGHRLQHTFRGPLCTMLNLFYHISVRYLLGKEVDDLDYFDALIPSLLAKYPKGTVIAYMAGRLQTIRGNIEDGMSTLRASVIRRHDGQWEKFRQLSYWELCFCNIIVGQYRAALHYAEILRNESNWSKAIYTYLTAAILCTCNDLTDNEHQQLIRLMEEVPSLKQRIVGKSVPAEKFVSMKSKRFFAQNNRLFLPSLEMMYCFSYFLVIKDNVDILDGILCKVNQALEELKVDRFIAATPYYVDNYCLATFLKGVCLRHLGAPLLAEELFSEVYENETKIKEDRYLIACTLLELGLISEQMGNHAQAIRYLNRAKKQTIFYTEFRIHQALQDIEARMTT